MTDTIKKKYLVDNNQLAADLESLMATAADHAANQTTEDMRKYAQGIQEGINCAYQLIFNRNASLSSIRDDKVYPPDIKQYLEKK